MKGEDAAYGVATFHSTYSVLKAEKILKEAGLDMVRLVPVPSQVSSDCGVAARFLAADMERAKALLLAGLADDLEGIYRRAGESWETVLDAER